MSYIEYSIEKMIDYFHDLKDLRYIVPKLMKMFILSFSAKFVLTWQLCSNSCHFLCTTRKYHHYQLNMYIGPTNFFIVGIHIKDFLLLIINGISLISFQTIKETA